MRIKYFKDTDTALFEFGDRHVDETRAISENVYVDLDAEGNIVAMTIEHAQWQGNLPVVEVEQVGE